jgi:hypothetical protein
VLRECIVSRGGISRNTTQLRGGRSHLMGGRGTTWSGGATHSRPLLLFMTCCPLSHGVDSKEQWKSSGAQRSAFGQGPRSAPVPPGLCVVRRPRALRSRGNKRRAKQGRARREAFTTHTRLSVPRARWWSSLRGARVRVRIRAGPGRVGSAATRAPLTWKQKALKTGASGREARRWD